MNRKSKFEMCPNQEIEMLRGIISIMLPKENVDWIDEKVKADAYTGYSYVVDFSFLREMQEK